jgi:two-component system, chemotaxis family, protein-glutamate methylesterase/glutaminase
MQGHDIIVIGASAGGVETLKQLVKELPQDLPASIFIVLHLGRMPGNSLLPAILERAGRLPAETPVDRTRFERGRIYVAAPDRHMLIEHDHVRVVRGPKENRHRPSVDPLFRSAAWTYGPRVVGVVLSGTLDDGAAGLWAIKTCGGVTVVQDPSEAPYNGMPTSAQS